MSLINRFTTQSANPTDNGSSDSDCSVHLASPTTPTTSLPRSKAPPIWWSNAIFFVGMHLLALYGVTVVRPIFQISRNNAWMWFISWQLASFGITCGYHRLWSHRAYNATKPLRFVFALMGALGFQGSIKWWVLRHRLHHAFTDTDNDPYDAQKGLIFSHVGWIFHKPHYDKMKLIDARDLNNDPIVRWQHKYYVPLALALGLVVPALIGYSYGDALGAFIYGGIAARITIWHATFLINSLAHYLGDQPYTLDLTARGNIILALFTGGEASHNYHHAFPKDYRNGPQNLDWDPTKWIIWALWKFTPLVTTVVQVPEDEILRAKANVLQTQAHYLNPVAQVDDESLPIWPKSDILRCCSRITSDRMSSGSLKRPLFLVIGNYVVEVSEYAGKHPGGVSILRKWSVGENELKDATEMFEGGLNNHGWTARDTMQRMRIAKIID